MAYNTSIHPTTGFTPFYLMFGRQAKLPVELMYGTPEPEPQSSTEYASQLKSSLTEAYEKVRVKTTRQLDHQAELYNKKVHGKPYEVGNHVWVLFPQVPKGKSKKLYRPWSGPFVVVKRFSDVTYRVQDVNNRRRRMVVHFNRLKPYKQRVQTPVKDRAKDKPPQSSTLPRHHFGAELELVDDECEDSVTTPHSDDPPQDRGANTEQNAEQDDSQSEQELVRRYPVRVRRSPDFYSGCGTHS